MQDFPIAFLLVFVVGIPLVIVANMQVFARGRSMLDEWAADNHLTIVKADYVMAVMPGKPFFWQSKEGLIFRIVAADHRGETKSGYALCPHFLSFRGNKVEVHWDK